MMTLGAIRDVIVNMLPYSAMHSINPASLNKAAAEILAMHEREIAIHGAFQPWPSIEINGFKYVRKP